MIIEVRGVFEVLSTELAAVFGSFTFEDFAAGCCKVDAQEVDSQIAGS